MSFLVDTSILVDHLRGHAPARELLLRCAHGGRPLSSASVVRAEVLVGMRREERVATMRLLNSIRWQPVTVEIADRAGALGRRYRAVELGIDVVDLMIAATAQLLGARLLTLNVRHFPMFPRLQRPY